MTIIYDQGVVFEGLFGYVATANSGRESVFGKLKGVYLISY